MTIVKIVTLHTIQAYNLMSKLSYGITIFSIYKEENDF